MHLSALLPRALPLAHLGARDANSTALKPWIITDLETHSPSGHPGNPTDDSLFFRVSDRNTLPAGTETSPSGKPTTAIFPSSAANCSATWPMGDYAPTGTRFNCTTDSEDDWADWSFVITGKNASTEKFGLKIALVDTEKLQRGKAEKQFVGSGQFAVGDNMEGECGGSGVCDWWQKADQIEVQQTLKSCTGTC